MSLEGKGFLSDTACASVAHGKLMQLFSSSLIKQILSV